MCFLALLFRKVGTQLFQFKKRGFTRLLQSLLNSNGHSDGHADHGVVACAQEAHHFDMGGDGGGTCELSIAVHTTHGVGQAVRSGACSHVIGMQSTAGATAGSDGEVLLALLDALLLVSAGDRMLDTGGVGGVAGDGDVNAFQMHDGNTFADIVSAVALDVCTLGLGVTDLTDHVDLTGSIVKLSLNIGKAVDTGDDLCSVLAQTVQDNAQGLLTQIRNTFLC